MWLDTWWLRDVYGVIRGVICGGVIRGDMVWYVWYVVRYVWYVWYDMWYDTWCDMWWYVVVICTWCDSAVCVVYGAIHTVWYVVCVCLMVIRGVICCDTVMRGVIRGMLWYVGVMVVCDMCDTWFVGGDMVWYWWYVLLYVCVTWCYVVICGVTCGVRYVAHTWCDMWCDTLVKYWCDTDVWCDVIRGDDVVWYVRYVIRYVVWYVCDMCDVVWWYWCDGVICDTWCDTRWYVVIRGVGKCVWWVIRYDMLWYVVRCVWVCDSGAIRVVAWYGVYVVWYVIRCGDTIRMGVPYVPEPASAWPS